jgi:hypothetical protein
MSTQRQYEFTEDQNTLIGSLAAKMSLVGLFLAVVGVIQIIMALLIVVAIYRDKIPADWVEKSKEYASKLPDDVKKQAEGYTLDKLPPKNHLWGMALNVGVVGLFYMLMGTWTRSAARSFSQIVTTQGQDISHLMNALSSLHSMYSLVYTLLVITLVCAVVLLGLSLYARFAG